MQAEVTAPKEYIFKEGRGQVICCLLAAHKMCQLPLILDLTDGKHHHLLRLRDDQLLVYQGCTPAQVSSTDNMLPASHTAHSSFSAYCQDGGSLLALHERCMHLNVYTSVISFYTSPVSMMFDCYVAYDVRYPMVVDT